MSKIPGGNSGIRPPQDEPKTDEAIGGEPGAQAGPAAGQPEPPKRVMSAADVERLASQAGFSRTGGKKNKKGIDLGDSSQAPIPLPEDDLDGTDPANAMNYESLAEAQSQMLHHGAAMTRSRGSGTRSLLGMWQALIAGEGTQDEDEEVDEAREARGKHLQSLASEIPPDAEAMAGLAASIREQFGIDLAGTPIGPQMMAASLCKANCLWAARHKTTANSGSKAMANTMWLNKITR